MDEIITAKDFLLNTFNTDFLSDEEKQTIIEAMQMYARGVLRTYLIKARRFTEEEATNIVDNFLNLHT